MLDTQMQTSILNPVSCYGIGVHSGKITQLTLKPAPENTGIVFLRTDVETGTGYIAASYDNVSETTLSTSVKNEHNISVSTIEHLMAAFWGCGVDNALVEIDGPEVPIMDGSSKPFVFMIECAGKQAQNAKRKFLKILKETTVVHKDSEITITPADKFRVDLTIEFASKAIGKQTLLLSEVDDFRHEIADARTFGFLHELDYLRGKGLAKGASLDNAIGIDKDVVLNHDGLRYQDEFVRHKMLDLAGDFYTCGGYIIGNIIGNRTGHAINNQLLRTLMSTPGACEWS